MTDLFAVIRLRGSVKVGKEITDTLTMLRLKNVNNCNLLVKSPIIEGMLRKVRGYITWGEIKKETLEKLLVKKGRLEGEKKLDEKNAKEFTETIFNKSVKDTKVKFPIRLHPASKGLKSVKVPWPKGDLGYRGDKINELLERMI